MIKIKEYNYGEGYFPKLFVDGGKIVDAQCKCAWALNNKKAFKKGDTLCKHIVAAMKEYNLEMWNKRKMKRIKILKNGYFYILINGKYFMEHRIVVENYIGRKLLKSERVHHINEIKTDNKIENLMLFENDSKHIKFHTKIRQFGFTNPILRQIENRWKIW